MIVILLGAPGSGKGTQAKQLSVQKQLPHLSTGDMFRSAISQGTALGVESKSYMDRGALVPDSVVLGLISDRIQVADCADGFILDGFPRNIPQAEALDRMLAGQDRRVRHVVLFDIEDRQLVRRLSGRRTCLKCGAMYHIENIPPAQEGVCDRCQSGLVQRPDDQVDVIQKRLAVYHEQTEPLVGFYSKQNKLIQIDASRSAEQVAHALMEVLA